MVGADFDPEVRVAGLAILVRSFATTVLLRQNLYCAYSSFELDFRGSSRRQLSDVPREPCGLSWDVSRIARPPIRCCSDSATR